MKAKNKSGFRNRYVLHISELNGPRFGGSIVLGCPRHLALRCTAMYDSEVDWHAIPSTDCTHVCNIKMSLDIKDTAKVVYMIQMYYIRLAKRAKVRRTNVCSCITDHATTLWRFV